MSDYYAFDCNARGCFACFHTLEEVEQHERDAHGITHEEDER